MKTLEIIIDGVVHQYTKVHISKKACSTCSLEKYCRNGIVLGKHLCNIFDLSRKCKPTGCYGNFQIINNE